MHFVGLRRRRGLADDSKNVSLELRSEEGRNTVVRHRWLSDSDPTYIGPSIPRPVRWRVTQPGNTYMQLSTGSGYFCQAHCWKYQGRTRACIRLHFWTIIALDLTTIKTTLLLFLLYDEITYKRATYEMEGGLHMYRTEASLDMTEARLQGHRRGSNVREHIVKVKL